MRWVCQKCGRTLNLGVEECPYCAAREAEAPPPAPKPRKPSGPRKAVYAAPSFSWKKLRKGLEVFLVVGLLLITVFMVILWAWPDVITW